MKCINCKHGEISIDRSTYKMNRIYKRFITDKALKAHVGDHLKDGKSVAIVNLRLIDELNNELHRLAGRRRTDIRF